MGCSRRFWPNQSTFLLSFHWECRRLKKEICALQRKEKAESFVWKSNLEAKRQKWQDQRAASTDFSLKIQFLMQRRIWAGSKWTAGGCTFAKYHKNNYLKGYKRSSLGWKEGSRSGICFLRCRRRTFLCAGRTTGGGWKAMNIWCYFPRTASRCSLREGLQFRFFK